MRNAVRQLAWVLVLLAATRTSAAEPVPLKDGGYQFNGECYQAVVDLHGRLATLQVNGQDILLPPSVNAKVYGASLVAGPEHRTPLDLPRMTIEAGMVVARGDGREVGYLPGDKALGVSPWEGHCYPEAFRRLQASYRQKYLAGQHQ